MNFGRIFENRMGTSLYALSSKELDVVLGKYNNNKNYLVEDLEKKIESIDGKNFTITYIDKKKINIGKIINSTLNRNEIIFSEDISSEVKINNYIYIENYGQIKTYKIKEIEYRKIVFYDIIKEELIGYTAIYTDNNYEFPDWIYQDKVLTFAIFENIDDNNPKYQNCIVKKVNNSIVNKSFEIYPSIELKHHFEIYAYKFQNNNTIKYNCYGEEINNGIFGTYNEYFIKCSEINIYGDDKKILIYDKPCKKLSGTISYYGDSIIGKETLFLNELNIEDVIFIDDNEYIVKNIISDTRIELYDYPEEFFELKNIFLTSEDSSEYIVNKNYNIENYSINSDIIKIKNNHKLFFKFGAKEYFKKSFYDKIINLEINIKNYEIFKIYLNGEFLSKKYYSINKSDNTITINDKFNIRNGVNYCYIILYRKEQDILIDNNSYCILSYNGYPKLYKTIREIFSNIPNFLFYINFSENLNNDYLEYKDETIKYNQRININNNHQISFSSYVSNDSSNSTNVITYDLKKYVNSKYFKIFRYNVDTHSITVYNKCELVNYPPDTLSDDVNIISYTINFDNKISYQNVSLNDYI